LHRRARRRRQDSGPAEVPAVDHDEQVVLRNYAGELFIYPQVKPKPKRRPRPAIAPCYSFDGAPPMP